MGRLKNLFMGKEMEEEDMVTWFAPTPATTGGAGGGGSTSISHTPSKYHTPGLIVSSTSLAGSWPTPASWQEDLKDVLKFCVDNDIWIRRTGSQLIEDVVPEDRDFVAEDIDGKLVPYLEQNGYWLGGSSRPEAQFMSWKKGEVNIIVCHDREYFRKYLMATELLKKMQPKTKQERINIFDTIFGTNNKDTDVPF